MTIKKIIVIQKTHLDIGFTALPSEVLEQYLHGFIPKALKLASSLSSREDMGFVWTTGSWLIHTALEQADQQHRHELEKAIEAGWLRWHVLPFTMHTELADPLLLRAGLEMSQQLDARYGLKTQAAKMTDVPGHGIGLVPILAEAGVKLLHLGVNPGCKLPDVPTAFRWRHQNQDVTVLYESGYGRVHPIPGSDAALAFLHTNDNLGPPSEEAIAVEFEALRAQFPDAQVVSGTLEDVVEHLDSRELPVVEAEIGDSWMHGVGSAPQRVSDLQAIKRALNSAPQSEGRSRAAQSALMVAEHTWGLDSKSFLPSREALDPCSFAHERRRKAWEPLERAYAEQDAYLEEAVERAGEELSPLLKEALAETRSRRGLPQPGHHAEPCRRWEPITTPRWVIRFDPANGTLNQLFDRSLGVDLCSGVSGGRLGILRYEVLGAERFRNWQDTYLLQDEELWWAVEDFGGPQQDDRFPRDVVLPTRANDLWTERVDGATELTFHHCFRTPHHSKTGSPPKVGLRYRFPDDPQAAITIDIGWDEKPPALCRESFWFGWRQGSDQQPDTILLDKLGTTVDASSVVKHGGLLHAVEGVTMKSKGCATHMRPLDAPLLCPDGPRILETRQDPLNLQRGVWWNLLNTAWSTNFCFWTEGAMGFRFEVELRKS